jgi:hypothetical protein
VEWDEDVWLDTLPAKLNHKIKMLGGAKRALTGLTCREEMMRVYGSKRGEELEKAFGQVGSCAPHASTHRASNMRRFNRASPKMARAIVCRIFECSRGGGGGFESCTFI